MLSSRYTLGRLLGKGGMGAVYEAEDTEQRRRVAVKIMSSDIAHSRSAVGRFEREARAASAIQTEHIVRVLDTGVDEGGAPFLVMELLRGEDLAHLLERLGPLPPRLALRIVAQACVGLQKAHDAGVVHRDIKPANLFLARSGEGGRLTVKVLDFGIAKIKEPHEPRRDTTGLTRSGSMIGTPRYMSPEQARGIKEIDHRTDVWALGIVLYHALAGRTPTQDVEAFGDLIAAVVAELPTPVQEFAPWVPPEVAAIVHGALQYQPIARYPSASAMLDAMRPLLGEDPLSLDEGMLVPLAPSERLIVAPKLAIPAPSSLRRRGGAHAGAGRGSVPDRWRDQTTDCSTGPAFETTEARRASEAAPPPRRSPWKAVLVAGALLAATLGWLVTHRPAPTQTAALTCSHLVRDLSKALPVESAAPPVAPDVRRVALRIVPADAAVEVDGVPARVKRGVVELTGALGSVRRVRVIKGGLDVEEGVLITETGALPPKLELARLPPRGSDAGRRPRPAAAASSVAPGPAAAASSAAPAAPTAAIVNNPLLPKRFE